MPHASVIADNPNYGTTSLRAAVQQVNQTVTSANQRVLQAVRITERRLNEFNALLGVVQEEAEQAFVTTAAAVRGVRTGARQLDEELRGDDPLDMRLEELDESSPKRWMRHSTRRPNENRRPAHLAAAAEFPRVRPAPRPEAARSRSDGSTTC